MKTVKVGRSSGSTSISPSDLSTTPGNPILWSSSGFSQKPPRQSSNTSLVVPFVDCRWTACQNVGPEDSPERLATRSPGDFGDEKEPTGRLYVATCDATY